MHTEKISAGATNELTLGLVHEIVNGHDEPATSIHVYSPPLATMTRYDAASLEPTATDLVAPEVPAYASSAAGALAHPSTRG